MGKWDLTERHVVTVVILTAFLFSCEKAGKKRKGFEEAQAIVDRLVAKHPRVVRLTIHAVPTGETSSRIIACNIKEKIGKPSDPEDLEAMKTNKTVVLKEGNHLDVTAPVPDRNGRPIAATGITLRFGAGEREAQLTEKAKGIARELSTAVQNADKPLW